MAKATAEKSDNPLEFLRGLDAGTMNDVGRLEALENVPGFSLQAKHRLEELRRKERSKLITAKPGFAATILTSGLGITDDDDNIRRPSLLGG